MEGDNVSKVEVNVYDGGQANFVKDNGSINAVQNNANENIVNRSKIKSRTREYADKWNANMFLNNFDKRDENVGVNVKLKEVYLEKYLPHYIWGGNKNISSDLRDLLKEYIYPHNDNKMLLILGQPGIGKSTLITWIAANFSDRIDDILVYKFASDLGNMDWRNDGIFNRLLDELDFTYDDLKGKTLILDGFDEVSISNSRQEILNSLYEDWIYGKRIINFSLIVTCRMNYIGELEWMKCKYITLQPWNEIQIRSFCNIFQEKTKNSVSYSTIKKLIETKGIFGIPLILYMVLALNISIEKEGSIVDVYDKIFSLDGGIYDRCIDNKKFSEKHRISEIKEQIHQVSREIAIWMFENNPNEAYICANDYKKICDNVVNENANNNVRQDFLIGNYFRLVKHCEGMGTEKLYFIHRSIYEYFVAETISTSIQNAMLCLTQKSQENFAENIAIYLRQGEVTNTIVEYIEHKIIKVYNRLGREKKSEFLQWWESAVGKMMDVGMFYFTKKSVQDYRNIINKEINCFLNLLEILRSLLKIDKENYIKLDAEKEIVKKYIRICGIARNEKVNLTKLYLNNIDLNGADLAKVNLANGYLASADLQNANLYDANLKEAILLSANLKRAELREADLSGANLKAAILEKADLKGTKLIGANLKGADLRGAELEGIDLNEAELSMVFFDEEQVEYLCSKYDLRGIRVYIKTKRDVISYTEYCKMRKHMLEL